MASTKTFADMKKPVRQPTPDEITAFEETGRAAPVLDPALLITEPQKSVSPDLPPSGDAEPREGGKPETQKAASPDRREHADPETVQHGNPPLEEPTKVEAQLAAKMEARKAINTETRVSGPIVRLTIDLAEADHTRFKAACAMTRRKMVDEVRTFIERRTAELEGEAGR